MRRVIAVVVVLVGLAGCATSSPPPVPRTLDLPTPPALTLREAAGLLMERGYVIRHGDLELGRLEAVLARSPGYRVRLEVMPDAGQTRLSATASRGGRGLPPRILDPLLTDLQSRLGLLP